MTIRNVAVEELVAGLHAANRPLVLAVTGGGSRAIADLLCVGGASRTVLEAIVPYAQAALVEFLGAPPEQACSERTSRAMAMQSYQRALRLSAEEPRPCLGLSCTASLASDRPKRGEHRAYLALQNAKQSIALSLHLAKGLRTRLEEETLVAHALLNLAAENAGLNERLAVPLAPGERVERAECTAPLPWQDLLAGRTRRVAWGKSVEPRGCTVFPGAFNPLHAGHEQMAALAARLLQRPVAFEISLENVDKPPLDYLEIERRLACFPPSASVWLTRAPTFAEKALLFPEATFVVGTDTLQRIADPKYHGGDVALWEAALTQIAAQGCRFLVFGRAHADRFETLGDLQLPPLLRSLSTGVPEETFRQDISSTQLRQAQAESAGES